MTTAVKERPILFSEPMVRAILDGRKTVTRRIMKPQPVYGNGVITIGDRVFDFDAEVAEYLFHDMYVGKPFPYGDDGDRLWVRETWAPIPDSKPSGYQSDPAWRDRKYWYAADNDRPTWGGNWRPSIFMPREACRIELEITDIRVERLQKITNEEAVKEGFASLKGFVELWDQLNSKRGVCKTCKGHGVVPKWSGSLAGGTLMQDSEDCPDCHGEQTGFGFDADPWVWRIEFKRVECE